MYDLDKTDLEIKQSSGTTQVDFTPLQMGYAQILDEKNQQIADLRKQLSEVSTSATPDMREMVREFGAFITDVNQVSFSKQFMYAPDGSVADTMFVCILRPQSALSADDKTRIERWLKVKGNSDKVKIYVEQPIQ